MKAKGQVKLTDGVHQKNSKTIQLIITNTFKLKKLTLDVTQNN
jgi:hypothetical protein